MKPKIGENSLASRSSYPPLQLTKGLGDLTVVHCPGPGPRGDQVKKGFLELNPYVKRFLHKNVIKTAPRTNAKYFIPKKGQAVNAGVKNTF